MAYTALASHLLWGPPSIEPTIYMNIYYDRKRSGADMQYKFKVEIEALNESLYYGSYFWYPIYGTLTMNGTAVVTQHVFKDDNSGRWIEPLVYESSWITVAGVTKGTLPYVVNIFSGMGSTRNYTYNYDLVVDPASSDFTAANGTLGTAQTIAVTKYDSSFTHTIVATCGSASQTVCTRSSSASVSWTAPVSFAAQGPNSNSVPVTLTCTTYNSSGSVVGLVKTQAVTMTIPSSVKPSASIAISDPTGNYSTLGTYLQTISKLRIQVTGTGSQGSTISAYNVTVGSLWTFAAADSTTPLLPSAGSLQITATVTDSRGRTGTATTTVSVTAYDKPKITATALARCDASGAAAPAGEYFKATFSAVITSINNRNTAAYKCLYRKAGASSWTEAEISSAAGNLSPAGAYIVLPAETGSAYEVRIRATDRFATTDGSIYILPIAFILAQSSTGGTGLSIGELATEDEVLSVAIPAKFKGGLQVQETASGSSSHGLEIFHSGSPYIDFHFGNNSGDYTSRIIETAAGALNFLCSAGLSINGARIDFISATADAPAYISAGVTIKIKPGGTYTYYIGIGSGGQLYTGVQSGTGAITWREK